MSRFKHYSKANLLCGCIAYCDQWSKVMAVYDEYDNLRAVVKEVIDDIYEVLLIGDDRRKLYFIDKVNLGSTIRNTKACYEIYRRLQHDDAPTFKPSYKKTEKVKLFQIFLRTHMDVRYTGGFQEVDENIDEKITKALEYYEKVISSGIEIIDCIE